VPPVAQILLQAVSTAQRGIDLEFVLGLPGTLVAVLPLLAYFVGFIHPVAIRTPRYWTTGSEDERRTDFFVGVKNRKFLADRNLTGLALVHIPSLRHRLRHPRWRRQYVDADPYVLWGTQIEAISAAGTVVAKRDELAVRGEIRTSQGAPLELSERLPNDVRVIARMSSAGSAMRKLEFKQIDRS
jgi:hypothetical protein